MEYQKFITDGGRFDSNLGLHGVERVPTIKIHTKKKLLKML